MSTKSISLIFGFRRQFSSNRLNRKAAYEILGLQINAHPNEIKEAYIKCSKQYHPDINGERNAEEIFKKVNEAYNTLKNQNMMDEDHFSSRSNQRSNYNFEDELDLESLKKLNFEKEGRSVNSKIQQIKSEQGFRSFRKSGTENATMRSRMNAFLKNSE